MTTNGHITWAQFLRCVLAGVAFLVGLSGGVVAWAMSTSSRDAVQDTQIRHIDMRIEKIEANYRVIDSKLDTLIFMSHKSKGVGR